MRSFFASCLVILFIASPIKTMADWAYPYVVWDGYVYVLQDEEVNEIGKEIGHVTKYSDLEGSYSGNFSNAYPRGTKYYEVKEVSSKEAIAVEVSSGTYRVAERGGPYGGNRYAFWDPDSPFFIIGILFVAVFTVVVYFSVRERKND
ncbi:hypothetical protein GI482_18615 [Bacillus sp. N3536]|nr:hypothetical protein GI482_18615 [Bacillus sp. N3536]